jgi:twitching motility protein PilT
MVEETTTPTTKTTKESATNTLHFEKWLGELGARRATDLHMTVGNVPALRIDGKITPLANEGVITVESMQNIVETLLNDAEAALLTRERQLVISKTLKKVMRFRIHIFYSRGFLALSLRHLPNEPVPLKNLPHAELLQNITSASQGLYIVAGPFDSGKSTTIRSLVSEINKTQAKYIVTLEEPIEYLIPSNTSVVVQREIGRDVPSFVDGLASLSDEDVNVVMISAIHDGAVLEHATQLAGSGRLVIAAGRGRDVVMVLEELRDLCDQEDRARILHQLADTLLGISVQLLLPKVGGSRTLLTSNLIVTHPIASLIREGTFEQIPNVMQTSREAGMVTMDKALVEAVKQGSVALKDAQEHAIDINQFNVLVSH